MLPGPPVEDQRPMRKGSSWEPEREHPVHSPKSAAYFRPLAVHLLVGTGVNDA